jgi:DUF1680 family protein
METCVTATWLKLNAQLLRMTGEARYADQIERTMYNSLIAAQETDGTWWCHYNPLEGHRQPAPEQCKMHMNCCVANGPRALMLLPELAFMSDREGPVVNFYESADGKLPLGSGRSVTLGIRGDYPRSGGVELTVAPDTAAEFTLKLRIPGWSAHTDVTLGGKPLEGVVPGAYSQLRRTWQRGDTTRLGFDLSTHVIHDPGASGRIALLRGPIVLTFDKRISLPIAGGGEARVTADTREVVAVRDARDALAAVVYLAVDVPVQSADGRKAMLRMCDYASAGRTWDAQSMLRVWMPQPLDLSDPLKGVQAPAERH